HTSEHSFTQLMRHVLRVCRRQADHPTKLEHLWDEIGRTHEVDILSGYVMNGFQREQGSRSSPTRTKYPLRAFGRSRPRGLRPEPPHPLSAHKLGAHSPRTAIRGGSPCAAFAASITRSPATLRHRAGSGESSL